MKRSFKQGMKTKTDTTDALEAAGEMMHLPMNKLPKLCQDYTRYLGNKVGMCMEVCLTAYAHYNQMMENMPCEDEQYQVTREGKEWFSANS